MSNVTIGDLFVGRARELEELRGALDAALAGRGGVCLLVGEPGIGKTSLAERLAAEGAQRGARVVRGPCWDAGGAPAYWPWIQVVRALAEHVGDERLQARVRRGAAELAQLVPELGERLGEAPVAPEAGSDERRFALFDAVSAFLAACAGETPLIVLMDDLHAADEGSLLLLSFVARQLHDVPALIVGTQRDVDADPSPLLADVARAALRLPLRGLPDEDIGRLIGARTGAAADERFVGTVREATAGNPFFVDEVIRLLQAEGRLAAAALPAGELPLPEGVREAITRRLGRLEPGTRALLSTAAVVGGEFSLGLLSEVLGLDRGAVLDQLAAAERAGLVAPVPGRLDCHRFAHALIRETLYRELSGSERMALHRGVAESLERLHGGDLDEHLSALAFHFAQAVPVTVIEKAVEYARLAGERAARQLAYEDAAAHFGRALSILDLGRGGGRERCDLLLAFGLAQRRAGDVAAGREAFEEAAALARDLERPELLAQAALGYAGMLGGPGFAARSDESMIALLEEALAALGREPSPARAQLLARLALELYYTPEFERRRALSHEAVEVAEATGELRSRMIALYSCHWSTLGPDSAQDRRRAADELLELARGSDDLEMRFSAHHFRMADCLEHGDLAGVDAEIDACVRLAEMLHQPLYRWQAGLFQAMRALLQGRAEEGERLALEAFEAGRMVDEETAANLLAAQLYQHRWITGRMGELADAIDVYAAQRPWIPAWRCGAAFLRAEIGQLDAARRTLDTIAFDELPRDGNWAMGVALGAYAAGILGARDHAEVLLELIEPVADRAVVLAAGDACIGPIALAAAIVATTLGRWDDAERHFAAAERMTMRLDARPLAARARFERARMLLARGERGAALGELEAGVALADELGMARLVERSRELLAEASVGGGAAGEGRSVTLVRTGDVWRVGDGASGVLVKDMKGLGYLARLLAAPGVEFHALDLAAEGGPVGGAAGNTGPTLDAEAKRAFRARISELEAELDEAHRFRDPEREARLREELDAIAGELARAVGLGGRDRPEGSDAERARINVTRALRSAISRIAEHDPALGHDLDRSVRTGTFVSYDPLEG